MAESKSVVIRLTNEQREAIKRATGKDITELKVDALEGRITPGVDSVEFRKAPISDQRKAPLDAGVLDPRKAPVADQRKAPLDTGALDQRKAPMGTDPDTN